MIFALQHLSEEFEQLHPAVRAIVWALDEFCEEHGLAPVTVTHARRSEASMAAIYGLDWRARGKFSWHLADRAVDVRNRDWSDAERLLVVRWLRKHWPHTEIIMHDIGHGDHLHIAVPAPAAMARRLRRWLSRRGRVNTPTK